MSHPLTAPEGVGTKTTAQGLSVHTHETLAWITQGSNMTHAKEGVEEGPHVLFCTNVHTNTKAALPTMRAASQAPSEDLVVPHTCQRQMLGINQREAHSEEKLPTTITPRAHKTEPDQESKQLHMTTSTPVTKVTVACVHLTCVQRKAASGSGWVREYFTWSASHKLYSYLLCT